LNFFNSNIKKEKKEVLLSYFLFSFIFFDKCIMTDLAKHDKMVKLIKEEIQRKKDFLNKKTTEIEKTSKTNSYLNHVKSNYKMLTNEKSKQIDSLQIILNYVLTLQKDKKHTEYQLREMNHDIEKIQKEINRLKENK
jgi:peptidoglycan hydrolase CwlO-like protein